MKKKKAAGTEIPPVDEAEFTEVIRKMVNTSPVTRKDVERRKNPETDPRYLPVFDFSRPMKLTPEQAQQVKMTQDVDREYRKKKKR